MHKQIHMTKLFLYLFSYTAKLKLKGQMLGCLSSFLYLPYSVNRGLAYLKEVFPFRKGEAIKYK